MSKVAATLKKWGGTIFFAIFVATQVTVGFIYKQQVDHFNMVNQETCEARQNAREVIRTAMNTFIDLSRARGLDPRAEVAVQNLEELIRSNFKPIEC